MERDRFNNASRIVRYIHELEKKAEFIDEKEHPTIKKEINRIFIVIEGKDEKNVSIEMPKDCNIDILRRINSIYLNLIDQFNKL